MRRPFVGILLAHSAGILLGEWIHPPVPLLFLACFGLALSTWFLPALRAVTFTGLILTAGWTHHLLTSQPRSAEDLRHLLSGEPQLALARGRILEPPERVPVVIRDRPGWRSRARVGLRAVRLGDRWQAAHGTVLATLPDQLPPRFRAGVEVRLEGVLRQPRPAATPRLFDYRRHLARQGIFFELATDSLSDWEVLPAKEPIRPAWSEHFIAWASATLARGLPQADEAVRLREAMLLGRREIMTDELSRSFQRSGTLHVFAISGLHISLVAMILAGLLECLSLPRGWAGLLVIPALWAYTAATGWQPSAVRASVMMSVLLAGWALQRPSDLLNSLAAAASLILLHDPRQLFRAGFQLSFGVVLSLAVLLPLLRGHLDRLLQVDPWLPETLEPTWHQRYRRATRSVALAFAVSLAAWLGSLPLVAYYFHLATPVSLIANLLIMPLTGVVVLCGLASLACGTWSAWATECFNHTGWLGMKIMSWISAWMADLPGAWRPVPPPTPLVWLGYYALMLWPLSLQWPRRYRRTLLVGGILSLTAGLLTPIWQQRDQLTITVLPVGGGDSIWIDAPGRSEDLLIDTGDDQAVRFVVEPFLRSLGRRSIPTLMLSHGDVRHVEGVGRLLSEFEVRQVQTGPFRGRSTAYRTALRLLEEAECPGRTVGRGDSGGFWEVLHPAATDGWTRADDQAVVLLVTWHGLRVLLCSDLGRLGQLALAERPPTAPVDIVVTGMPSENEPLLEPLLDQLQPRAILLSTGRYPANQQASRALQLRLARSHVPLFFSGTQGAITVTLNPRGGLVRAMDGSTCRITARTRPEPLSRPSSPSSAGTFPSSSSSAASD